MTEEIRNPYASGITIASLQASVTGPQGIVITPELAASRTQRFFTYIIDYALIYVGIIVIFGALGVLAVLVEELSFILDFAENENKLIEYAIGFAATLMYYTGMEGLFKTTPGKLICGTRIVNLDGNSINFKQAFIRSATRLIPFETLSIFFSKDTKRNVMWHDDFSRTRVISRKALHAMSNPESTLIKNSSTETRSVADDSAADHTQAR